MSGNLPKATRANASAVMRGNRGADTRPEVSLRSALHRLGLRFRRGRLLIANGLRSRPDIVFPGARVVVFVDGCFWHSCPQHGMHPKANSWYWKEKLRQNVERDDRITEALGTAGWVVIRVWEHESSAQAAIRVARIVKDRSATIGGFRSID